VTSKPMTFVIELSNSLV